MSGEDEWGAEDSGPQIYAEMRMDDLKDELEALKAKLKRYEEREPLVQALLDVIFPGGAKLPRNQGEILKYLFDIDDKAFPVRDFKLE